MNQINKVKLYVWRHGAFARRCEAVFVESILRRVAFPPAGGSTEPLPGDSRDKPPAISTAWRDVIACDVTHIRSHVVEFTMSHLWRPTWRNEQPTHHDPRDPLSSTQYPNSACTWISTYIFTAKKRQYVATSLCDSLSLALDLSLPACGSCRATWLLHSDWPVTCDLIRSRPMSSRYYAGPPPVRHLRTVSVFHASPFHFLETMPMLASGICCYHGMVTLGGSPPLPTP